MQRLARIAFFIAASVAFVMAALPHPPPIPGHPSDKLLHMLAFATLGLLAGIGFRARSLPVLLLALSTFGAAIELVQAIPALNRDSEIGDLIADVVAALAGLWCGRWIITRRADRKG